MGIHQTNYGDKLEQEVGGEAHIPYTSHVDANTLRTKDGKLIQIIKVEGVAHQTSDDSQLEFWKNARNNLWRSISDGNISIWTHVVRYKKNDYPKGEFHESFAQKLNNKYKDSLKNTEMFVNDLYICVVRKNTASSAASFIDTLKGLISKEKTTEVRAEQRIQISELNKVTSKVLKSFKAYSPKLLTVYTRNTKGVKAEIVKEEEECIESSDLLRITKKEEQRRLKIKALAPFSEPLEFIGFLVNGFWKKIPLGYHSAAKSCLYSKLDFQHKDIFVLDYNGKRKCGGTISIKEYVNYTVPGMLDVLMELPAELIITQSFTFMNRPAATQLLKQHQARMKNAGDLSQSQIDEIDDALDMLTAGEFSMGSHHMTVTCVGESKRLVDNNLGECEANLNELGILTSREYLGLEPCFWAQLPGNNSYIARKSPISSINFSSFSSFHNYPQGKQNKNWWGDAVALLKTVSGTPYYFNFHFPKDLGNTTVIGPSGAGKTTLMMFLSAQAEKFYPTQVFFDKDRGAEIFVRAQGGVYSPIEAGKETGFNPLQLPDTPKNRKFLRDWIAKLAEKPGEPLTAEQSEEIAMAVNGNFKLDQKERRLSNIYPFFKIGDGDSIKSRLKPWLKDGDKGWVFDNETDSLTLDARLIGFDVTDFLDDAVLRTPLLMYLFHRVDSLVDGRKLIKWLDEGWKLLDDEYFSKKYKNDQKVIRKQNGFNVFGTQEPNDVITSAIGKTVLGQSPTKIFLPNPDADRADYIDGFKLTEREFEIISEELTIESRCFLVKQGRKSVVAELDLAGMDNEIAVLSGNTENVEILAKIREEVGDDPNDWLPIFYQRRS